MKEGSVCKNTLDLVRDFGCEFLLTEAGFPPTLPIKSGKVTILLYTALTSASCSSHCSGDNPGIIKKPMSVFKMLPEVKGEERKGAAQERSFETPAGFLVDPGVLDFFFLVWPSKPFSQNPAFIYFFLLSKFCTDIHELCDTVMGFYFSSFADCKKRL